MYIVDYKISNYLYDLRDYLLVSWLSYMEQNGSSITNTKRTLAKNAVGCFVLNSFNSYFKHKSSCYVSLNKNTYTKARIINGERCRRKVSYLYFKRFIDYLEHTGLVEIELGKVNSYNYSSGKAEIIDSTLTRINFTYQLIQLFEGLVPEYSPEQLVDVIHLKDKNKRRITFKSNQIVSESKEVLDSFNKFSMKQVVTHDGKEYDVQQYKVFNNSSFKEGGRSFMSNSIQSLSKEERKEVLIGGNPVCIYDFKGFEPSILYTLCQEKMEWEDPYEISIVGYDKALLRTLSKHALLIMLNASSHTEAKYAMDGYIQKTYDISELFDSGKIPAPYIYTDIIFDLLETKHHLIINQFYTSVGTKIQNVGSRISDFIVSYMMQKYDVLVLQVFDEFICDRKYRVQLYDTMKEGWKFVLGTSDNCNITVEQ